MNEKRSRNIAPMIGVCLAVLTMLAPRPVCGQVRGTIVKKDSARMSGVLKWQERTRTYSVTAANRITFEVRLDQVGHLEVPRPRQLDSAVAMLKGGQLDTAVPLLEKVVQVYTMLNWDIPAARYLAEAYVKQTQFSKAKDMCERVIATNPNVAYSREFSAIYWEVLLQTGELAKLHKELERAVKKGSRGVAAVAQLKRGDIDRKKGKLKDALLDGYLRTVVLYKDIKGVQPEALYKAAKCFEELGEHRNAEEMRKRLLAEFSEDSYAEKLRSGT